MGGTDKEGVEPTPEELEEYEKLREKLYHVYFEYLDLQREFRKMTGKDWVYSGGER